MKFRRSAATSQPLWMGATAWPRTPSALMTVGSALSSRPWSVRTNAEDRSSPCRALNLDPGIGKDGANEIDQTPVN